MIHDDCFSPDCPDHGIAQWYEKRAAAGADTGD